MTKRTVEDSVHAALYFSELEKDGYVVREMFRAAANREHRDLIFAIRIAHHLRRWIEDEGKTSFQYDEAWAVAFKIMTEAPDDEPVKLALRLLREGGLIRPVHDRNRTYKRVRENDDLI